MISLATVAAFSCTAVILALVPGPDNLFVLAQSALIGARRGAVLTLGLCSGLLIYSAAVAFGVAYLFAESEVAFVTLKAVGACYLLYMAYGAFRAGGAATANSQAKLESPFRAYLRGVVMNLSNPKVAIFFLAFLPQFTSPAAGSIRLQLLELGGIFTVCALTVFMGISQLAGRLSGWMLKSERSLRLLNQSAGVIFVLLAVKVAVTSRH